MSKRQNKNERPGRLPATPDAHESLSANLATPLNVQPRGEDVEEAGIAWQPEPGHPDSIEFLDLTPAGRWAPLSFEHVWPRFLAIDRRAPLDDACLTDWVSGPHVLEAFRLAAVDSVVDRFEPLVREGAGIVYSRLVRRVVKQADVVQLRDLVRQLLGDLDAAAHVA
jgi:hypothetical protein